MLTGGLRNLCFKRWFRYHETWEKKEVSGGLSILSIFEIIVTCTVQKLVIFSAKVGVKVCFADDKTLSGTSASLNYHHLFYYILSSSE